MADGATAQAVIDSARTGEPDRYLAALLAPAPARSGLLALAAFSAELGRISQLVTREPMMGEIRLQWWRDALASPDPATRTGNPVADAVRETAMVHALPASMLLGMVDARASDLQAEPFATEASLDRYLAGSEANPFNLGARITGGAPGPDLEAASADAGRAYGLVRLLLGLPLALAQGRLPLPRARLERAGIDDLPGEPDAGATNALISSLSTEVRANLEAAWQHVAKLPRQTRVAFLPLALVGPYLRALERPGRNPLRDLAEITPLQRIWRIASAHWLDRK